VNRSKSLYAPRHWPTWFAVGGLRAAVTLLPWSWNLALGRALGRLAFRLAGKRVRIARRNLERCFPECSRDEREALLRRHFASLGMALFETGLAWWTGPARLARHLEVAGREHLDAALDSEQGVILVVAHATLVELGGRFIAAQLGDRPRALMYRPADDPVLERMLVRRRRAAMGELIARDDARDMVRRLRRGEVVWYASDQNYGGPHSVFAPFFGILAATNPGISRLARLGRARLLFANIRRVDDRGRYLLRFEPGPVKFPGASPRQDAEMINRAIERWVREAPEQYLWIHRRFKTRPEGEPPFYD